MSIRSGWQFGLVSVVSVFLVGWTVPQPEVNCPKAGSATEYLLKDGCTPTKSVDCIAISTQLAPNVIMYIYEDHPAVTPISPFFYEVPHYGVFNPFFLAAYTKLLQDDCFNDDPNDDHDNTEACSYLAIQLNWFDASRESPHKGEDIWRYPNGYADGMTQAEIAYLYDRQYQYESQCDTRPESVWCKNHRATTPESYRTKSDRAGKAFDWAYGNSGVAHAYDDFHFWYMHVTIKQKTPHFVLNTHNKALIRLNDLCVTYPGSAWCTRLARGINALREPSLSRVDVTDFVCPSTVCSPQSSPEPFPYNWSYYRVGKDPASCGYHRLNADTLLRLVDRGHDSGPWPGILQKYASDWSKAFDQAVAMQKCSNP